MGVRAEKWPEAQRGRLAAFFSRLGFKPTGRVEGGDRVLRSREARRRPAGKRVFPDATTAALDPARDPRLVFADWLIAAAKSVVHPRHRQSRLVVAPRPRHRARARRPARRQPARQPRTARRTSNANSSRQTTTSAAALPLHPQLDDLPTFVAGAQRPPRRRGELRALRTPPPRRRGADRRAQPDHRHDGEVLQPDPGAVHLHSRDQRSIALPDGSITSSFLETFGRPARDTGLEAERINGSPRRNACTCSTRPTCSANWSRARNSRPSPSPRHRARSSNRSTIPILSRPPTARSTDSNRVRQAAGRRRGAALDLAWALINSAEFLHRH
jgi:hypothetical protein